MNCGKCKKTLGLECFRFAPTTDEDRLKVYAECQHCGVTNYSYVTQGQFIDLSTSKPEPSPTRGRSILPIAFL